jgi:hypothetical protein
LEAAVVAKRFFYVCAGLFLLVLSYEIGASRVGAQTPGGIQGAAIAWVTGLPSAYRFSGVEGRMFHAAEPYGRRYDPPEPIPGTASIIATDPAGFEVMLEGGDVYQYTGNGLGWTFVGNLLGGVTPTVRETFGGLKARYRR